MIDTKHVTIIIIKRERLETSQFDKVRLKRQFSKVLEMTEPQAYELEIA